MSMSTNSVGCWTTRNGRLERIEKFLNIPGYKDEEILTQLKKQLDDIKGDTYIKEIKKEIAQTCEEMSKEVDEKDLRSKIFYFSTKLHTLMATLVGYSQVIKRAGRYVPFFLTTLPVKKVLAVAEKATGAAAGTEKIREAFEQLMGVATAVAEPILWFYALTAFIMMATGRNKTIGWTRLKNVGYAYVGITMLPAIFAFLRWLGNILKTAFSTF